jgi:iron complex outermembrane receptor protein
LQAAQLPFPFFAFDGILPLTDNPPHEFLGGMMKRCVLLSAGLAQVLAQAAVPAEMIVEAEEHVVVVGSRGTPRLATETSAPVDVLSGEELAARGHNDLTKVLEFLSPAFNYPRTSSGPSVAGARPATLRGLGPDQVLVLIDGHRRHSSSIVTFNNGAYRGSVPIDFNTIPIAAIERIEILRDGAAAQYGSDAIAGVINVILKGRPEGRLASIQYGETERGEGETTIAAGSQGFSLGQGGFLTITGEFRDRGSTNAAQIDPRFGRVTSTLGDPATTDADLVLNAELPLAGESLLYGFVTGAHRDSEMSPLFRAPTVAPSFYPNGFLPVVTLELADIGANIGARGMIGDWSWDLSDTYGYSKGDYRASNTVNTSLGAASPTRFYGGGSRYAQNLVNLTVHRGFELLAGAHLATGLEHRYEAYELVRGDTASYTLAGAQGFPGFNPPTPVDVSRKAVSAFVDTELRITDRFNFGLAARYEDYSDFGDETTGKVSAFWQLVDLAALRATASTGIRAPALQQQYFSTVTSQLNGGQLLNVGNFAVGDPVSVALGASPLQPESSTSYSAGVVLTPAHGLSLSVDAYRIDIDDRIALSENIQGPQVAAILLAHGITNAAVARFFTNAADTRSEGWEATLRWDTRFGSETRLGLTFGYGSFDTDVVRTRTNPVLPQIALLGPNSIGVLADGQPGEKALLNALLEWGDWRVTADVTQFGTHLIPTTLGIERIDGSTSLDLSVAYRIDEAFTLMVGALNATDEYPGRVVGDNTGRPYSEFDPLGFNGREYYVRCTAEF